MKKGIDAVYLYYISKNIKQFREVHISTVEK